MRKGFFDNDILIKLAGCDLMADARRELDIGEDWVLSSLKPQLTNPKKRGKLAQSFSSFPKEAKQRILDFVDKTHPLPPAENHALIDRCLTEHRLDMGEVQLLEAALRSDEPLLITGDKRFLSQLVTIPELLAQALEHLPGCFVCLESVLLLLIDRNGYEYVRDKVLPFKEYDGQLKIAFGGGESKTEDQAREALIYELTRLGEDMGRLLHYCP